MVLDLASRLRDPRGVTLTELVVTLALLGLVMSGTMLVWSQTQQVYFVGAEAAEDQQNVRAAIDFMVRELRSAGRDVTVCAFDFANIATDCDAAKRAACAAKTTATFPNGNGPLGTGTGCQGIFALPAADATATTIRIRSDRNSNGVIVGAGNASGDSADEDVRYALAAAGSCPAGIPGACITRDDGSGPVAMVGVDISGFQLTYYPRRGFPPCNSNPPPNPPPNPCPAFTLPLTQDQADNVARVRIMVTARSRQVQKTLATDVFLRNRS